MRKATEADLWNGKITVYWVQKPGGYSAKTIIPKDYLDQLCVLLSKLLGGKFSATIEPDTKEVVKGG